MRLAAKHAISVGRPQGSDRARARSSRRSIPSGMKLRLRKQPTKSSFALSVSYNWRLRWIAFNAAAWSPREVRTMLRLLCAAAKSCWARAPLLGPLRSRHAELRSCEAIAWLIRRAAKALRPTCWATTPRRWRPPKSFGSIATGRHLNQTDVHAIILLGLNDEHAPPQRRHPTGREEQPWNYIPETPKTMLHWMLHWPNLGPPQYSFGTTFRGV